MLRLSLLCLALAGCKPEPKVPRLVETFGIETAGDEFTTIFPAGAALPTSYESTFSTQDDQQSTFKVRFISVSASRRRVRGRCSSWSCRSNTRRHGRCR
ncbi:MAG: hypothetical protein JNM69_00660 [Archangium sp.]|nr:hypothetical protein [Archangium sp.]